MLIDRKVKFYLLKYLILKNGFIIFHLLSLCLYTSLVVVIVSDRLEDRPNYYRNPGSHVFHLLIIVCAVFAFLPARVPGSYLLGCFINPFIVVSSFFVRLVFLRNDFRYGNDYRNPGSHVSHLLITVGTVFALLPARVPGSYLFVCFINPVIVISSFFCQISFSSQ